MNFFNIFGLNINHKVLKEGTKNTENDRTKLSELGFLGLKDFWDSHKRICGSGLLKND